MRKSETSVTSEMGRKKLIKWNKRNWDINCVKQTRRLHLRNTWFFIEFPLCRRSYSLASFFLDLSPPLVCFNTFPSMYRARISRWNAGGRAAEVQKGAELEPEWRRPGENEARADGEEGTEHAKGNPDREQRDAGAEEPGAAGGSGESSERGNGRDPEKKRRIEQSESD